MSIFGVILVRVFLHLNWIRTRITPNTDTFYAVLSHCLFSKNSKNTLFPIFNWPCNCSINKSFKGDLQEEPKAVKIISGKWGRMSGMGMKSKSSHQRCSIQKAFLENFAIFTGIHLCRTVIWTHFFFIKNRVQPGCFPVNIAKFLRTPILKDICEWLLLLTEQHDV